MAENLHHPHGFRFLLLSYFFSCLRDIPGRFCRGPASTSRDGHLPRDKPTQKTTSQLLSCSLSLSRCPRPSPSVTLQQKISQSLPKPCPSNFSRQKVSQPLTRTCLNLFICVLQTKDFTTLAQDLPELVRLCPQQALRQ